MMKCEAWTDVNRRHSEHTSTLTFYTSWSRRYACFRPPDFESSRVVNDWCTFNWVRTTCTNITNLIAYTWVSGISIQTLGGFTVNHGIAISKHLSGRYPLKSNVLKNSTGWNPLMARSRITKLLMHSRRLIDIPSLQDLAVCVYLGEVLGFFCFLCIVDDLL